MPIMAIGGFTGTDPAPSLAEFHKLVAQGKIHDFVGGGGTRGTMNPGSTTRPNQFGGRQFPGQERQMQGTASHRTRGH